MWNHSFLIWISIGILSIVSSPERPLDVLMQYEFNVSSTKKAGVCVDGDILALVAYADNRTMPVATSVAV
jgi:hypothetical protein